MKKTSLDRRDSPGGVMLAPIPCAYEGKEYPSTRAALRAKRDNMGCGKQQKGKYATGLSHHDHEVSIRNSKVARRKKKNS